MIGAELNDKSYTSEIERAQDNQQSSILIQESQHRFVVDAL